MTRKPKKSFYHIKCILICVLRFSNEINYLLMLKNIGDVIILNCSNIETFYRFLFKHIN